jgi:purine-cytosine permease-like protein
LFFDLLGSVNAFIGAIVVTTTPWMVIMAIGFFVRRGHYETADLQVFNERKKGGRYWFQSGINWRGMVAWIVAAGLGLQFAYFPPVIEGVLSGVAGGIDLSLIVAIGTAAILYIGALLIFPEPSYVYGPKGPRLVRSRKATVPPITS